MRQLIVLGGGGFLMEDSPLLDQYVLAASGVLRPRICFVPTASGEAEATLLAFYRSHARYDCRASHLSLFRPKWTDLDQFLGEQDVIFVGGGNTRSMLALWREWGVDTALRRAYEAGVVIAGVSAGMICWFEQGLTDSNPGPLAPIAGLGWLPGGGCPHYDGESTRRPALHAHLASQRMSATWAADDGAALHFVDESLRETVSSRPQARVWRVERDATGGVVERACVPRYLGS